MRERIRQYNHSISAEFLKLTAVAAVCACLLYYLLGRGSTWIVSHHFEGDAYVKKKNAQQVEDFSRYVNKYQVSVDEKAKLTKWIQKNPLVSLQVFKDGTLQYDSAYPDLEDTWSVDPDDYYGWQTYYTVQFADGEADVFINGYYGYQFVVLSMIIRIILSVMLFLSLIIIGIRKIIRYIRTLSREIAILESGDLDYEITQSGQNELTDLARGLNAMRLSLKEQMELETQMTQNHARLITEMSHDLRTPLTSILVYTQILKQHAYTDEAQLQDYLQKIESKGMQMKQRTDNLFAYALSGSEEDRQVEVQTFAQAFYERISDLCAYLEDKQFAIELGELQIPEDTRVEVDTEYLERILDNVVSNIIKYGDRKAPVRIETGCTEDTVQLIFENRIAAEDEYTESHHIGLKNVEKMMGSMRGNSVINAREGTFRIQLNFHRAG